MRLIFHGHLRDYFPASVEMNCRTVADAIEGIASQTPNFPAELRVKVVGHDTEESLFSPTETEEVHIVPAMFGGGGKFFGIILGGLMIASAFLLPGIGIGLSAALKTSLIVSGAMMAVQGVVSLFMKAPTASKSEDPPPSKYLGVTQNTTAQGTRITLACGRVLLAGHWLSLQSDADKLSTGIYPANPT
ncbi:hypothetical protein KNJ79_05425 [Sphingopyxis indica]|uniref:hypothetical protein n=1 Tax=Sphingopyxis indica TaxID=436663 RepID=UPI00293953BA|nr:hypothetical protein [Sphingopyxis indica]WOF44374.1 hypothetical protein KNJ79_05425 [Sphingopyxis indica]